MRVEMIDEVNRKRAAPSEPTDGLDHAKRQRVAAAAPNAVAQDSMPVAPPLPPGPISHRQLYTLNPEGSTVNFDVQAFRDPEMLVRILVPVLQSVDQVKLGHAMNVCQLASTRSRHCHPWLLTYIQIVRSRYLSLSQAMPRATAPAAEDEEEYEPDFEPEDAEQIHNKLDGLPQGDLAFQPVPSASLAPYKLPEAPPLSEQEVQKYGDMTVHRAFGMLSSVDDTQKSKATKGGFNRLAASDYGRDAWVTILSRLATRASVGLEDLQQGIKDEHAVSNAKGSLSISDTVRDGMYNYILSDWKKRIDVATLWLNEEWYNDTVLAQSKDIPTHGTANGDNFTSVLNTPNGNYQRCALRLIDGIFPYVEHTDKIIMRFLSEVPALNYEILIRLKKMAEDPERIDLACSALHYLYMFRPPVKDIVVNVLTEIYQVNERARPSAKKLLARWKPEVLGGEAPQPVKAEAEQIAKESANGALEVKAAS